MQAIQSSGASGGAQSHACDSECRHAGRFRPGVVLGLAIRRAPADEFAGLRACPGSCAGMSPSRKPEDVTGSGRNGLRHDGGRAWGSFDPGRNMPGERRGGKMKGAAGRFLDRVDGHDGRRRAGADGTVRTIAATRAPMLAVAVAIFVRRSGCLRGRAGMFVLVAVHTAAGCCPVVQRCFCSAGGGRMMHHAALERHHPRDALQR